MSLVTKQQIADSPNNRWGEVTVPTKAGRRVLSPEELARLGLHTFWYQGEGRWQQPRETPSEVPETEIDRISRALLASDQRYEAALANKRKRESGFLGKLRKGAGKVMSASTRDPKAKAALEHIAATASVGDVARGVIRNPALKVVAAAASVVFPPALAVGAAIVAADKAATALAKGDVAGALAAGVDAATAAGVSLPTPAALSEVLKSPTVQGIRGAVQLPEQLARAALGGGVVGATRDALEGLASPQREAAIRAVAVDVTSIGAARKVVDELEQANAANAAKVAAQIGATTALAERGDADARQSLALIDKARAERTKLSALRPAVMNALEALWASDARVQGLPIELRVMVRPARIRGALELVLRAGFYSPSDARRLNAQAKRKLNAKLSKAVDVIAAVLEAGRAHSDSPYFRTLGGIVSGELGRLADSTSPYAVSALRALEKKVGVKMARRSTELNRLVRAYNEKNPRAVAVVTKLRERTAKGDPKARQGLDEVRRRAAALKAAGAFTVDVDGNVRKRA